MKELHEHNIDEIFDEAFDDFKVEPSDFLWDKIKKEIPSKAPDTSFFKKWNNIPMYFIFASAISLLSFFGYKLLTSNNEKIVIVKNTTINNQTSEIKSDNNSNIPNKIESNKTNIDKTNIYSEKTNSGVNSNKTSENKPNKVETFNSSLQNNASTSKEAYKNKQTSTLNTSNNTKTDKNIVSKNKEIKSEKFNIQAINKNNTKAIKIHTSEEKAIQEIAKASNAVKAETTATTQFSSKKALKTKHNKNKNTVQATNIILAENTKPENTNYNQKSDNQNTNNNTAETSSNNTIKPSSKNAIESSNYNKDIVSNNTTSSSEPIKTSITEKNGNTVTKAENKIIESNTNVSNINNSISESKTEEPIISSNNDIKPLESSEKSNNNATKTDTTTVEEDYYSSSPVPTSIPKGIQMVQLYYAPSSTNISKTNYLEHSIGIGYIFSIKRIEVSASAEVHLNKDKYTVNSNYYSEDLVGSYQNVDSITFVNGSPTFISHTENVYDSIQHTKNILSNRNMTYIKIPLSIGYQFNYKKIAITPLGGLIYNKLMHQNIKSAASISDSEKQLFNLNNSYLQAFGGIKIGYRLNDFILIAVEPQYIQSISNIYTNQSSKSTSLRLKAGIQFDL
ncbi:MAG: hypothetical protein WCK02_07395 [Bacteroidota bacterium]